MVWSLIDCDRLAADHAVHRTIRPEVLRRLLAAAPTRSPTRVLEVGRGTGNYLRALRGLSGWAIHGIDPSPGMLARARAAAPDLPVVPGRAERLEFVAGTFDLVFSVDVIHHVRDRAAYFREAERALAPAGRILTVTDSERVIRHRAPLSVYFPETVDPELRRHPSLPELRGRMAEARFGRLTEETVECVYDVTRPEPYRRKALFSLHLIPEPAFRRGIDRMEEDLRRGPICGVSRYVLLGGTKGADRDRAGNPDAPAPAGRGRPRMSRGAVPLRPVPGPPPRPRSRPVEPGDQSTISIERIFFPAHSERAWTNQS